MGVMVRSGGNGVFKKEDRSAVDVGKLAMGLQEERMRSGGARARKVNSTLAVEKLIAEREQEGAGPLITKVTSSEREEEMSAKMSAKEKMKKERKERKERKLKAELENAQKQKSENQKSDE